MGLGDKIEDKLYERCSNCPFYYYEEGWEDCSEGCLIKGSEWDSEICVNMFLPRFILKIKLKLWEAKEERMYRKMDVRVNQKPVSVTCVCDKCEYEEEISYDDFVSEYDEPPEWRHHIWKCPECGHENEIVDQDWE